MPLIRPLVLSLSLLIPTIAFAQNKAATKPAKPATFEEYGDFYKGDTTDTGSWVQSIKVSEPAYRSTIKGTTTVKFVAPGMSQVKVLCWQQPTETEPSAWGHDAVVVASLKLDADGAGSFDFKADEFPNGPTNVRIFATNDKGQRDLCELQLYNDGGVKWNQGIPKKDPPQAKGMTLTFSDDFDGPLSISKDGKGAKYNAHKPTFGDFSGWQFADPEGEDKPFGQVGTYLKIAARKEPGTKGRSGLIAPVDMDRKGFWATPPAYLECRFTAQSAPGTWPAFWTITQTERNVPGDELDIIEAYGGVGPKNPNHPGYSIASHFWNQKGPDGGKRKGVSTRVPIMELGGKSYWSTTFHTYGVLIGREETVYYFDDIEVLRHKTNDKSLEPHCFLINYAIGGISGWKIDLERYGNGTDMYVDWVRVYEQK